MKSRKQKFEDDFDAIVKDFSTLIRFNGKEYTGTMSPLTLSTNDQIGGMFEEVDAVIEMKARQFIEAKPVTGDIIRVLDNYEEHVRHKNYRVVSVEYPDGIVIRISVRQEGK